MYLDLDLNLATFQYIGRLIDQPPPRWEPFVAATTLRYLEPTKQRVAPTILSIIAIEITHLTMFTLLLPLRIQRLWHNHVA